MSQEQLNKAIAFHQKNQLNKAIKLYESLLTSSLEAQVRFLLGTALIQNKNFLKAIDILETLIEIEPTNFHALSNLAIAHMEVENYHLSESFFKRSININPSFYHNFNNLGNLYFKQKKYFDSIDCYSHAIKFDNQPDFIFNRAKAFMKSGMLIKAENEIAKIPNNYNSIEYIYFKVDLLLLQERFQTALDLMNSLDSKIKNDDSLLQKKITAQMSLFDLDGSLQSINMLKSSDIKNFCYGMHCFKKFNYAEALELFKKSISHPNLSALSLNNIGLIHRDTGKLDDALIYFDKAISKDSSLNQAKVNKALILLRKKIFTEGWKDYKSRYKPLPKVIMQSSLAEFDANGMPNLDCLIIYEQGLGDQFFYLQLLNNSELIKYSFLIDERLLSIFSDRFPEFNFYSLSTIGNNLSNFDYYFFMADLFAKYIPDEKSIPSVLLKNFNHGSINQRILHASKKIRIGLSWKTSKNYSSSRKSVELNHIIDSFTEHPDKFEFVNLQYGDIQTDLTLLSARNREVFFDTNIDLFNDIDGLSSLVNECDFIITIGNVTAHIAGFFGRKCFLLLPRNFETIWYWHDDVKSTWYPNTEIHYFDNNHSLKSCIESIVTSINHS